jgi:hypothetical protein
MRTLRFLFAMIVAAALLRATSLAGQANSATQQTPSQGGEKILSDQPRDSNRDRQVSDERLAGTGDTDREQNTSERATRRAVQRRPSQSHAKPAPTHQLRSARTPVARNLRPKTLENGMGFYQLGSTTSSGVANKAVSHRSAPVPAATVAVSGQQFRNPRDPGARLAISGGPLAAARGTAAINGTNMKRKP